MNPGVVWEVVADLNGELDNKIFDSGCNLSLADNHFSCTSNGDTTCVEFAGVDIWDSENDERTENENGVKEPLRGYLLHESKKIVRELINLLEVK